MTLLADKEFADLMLEWGELHKEISQMEAKINAYVMSKKLTQSIGDVRANYRSGRKTYFYQKCAEDYDGEGDIAQIIANNTVPKTDWRSVCIALDIDQNDIEFKQGNPVVNLEVLPTEDDN